MSLDNDKLQKKLEEKVKNGKIRCADALSIAMEMKIPPAKVGEKLNQIKVKIISCQLGCFS